jgi:hypothetical protein
LRLKLRIWQAYCANALLTPPMADAVTLESLFLPRRGSRVPQKQLLPRSILFVFKEGLRNNNFLQREAPDETDNE